MEPSIRLSRGYRAAVGGNRDHCNCNWTIGIGTVDPILAGVPYGGSLPRLPPVFRAYASIHRFSAPWPLRAAMAPWSPVTVGPPWPFGALCAGQSSVDPILAGVPYGVSPSRLPPAFRAYASIHGPLCPLAPKGRHGPSARGRHGPSGPSVRGRAPSIHCAIGAPVRARSGREWSLIIGQGQWPNERGLSVTHPLTRPRT